MSDWIVNQVDRLSSLLHDSVMFYVFFFFVFFFWGGGGGGGGGGGVPFFLSFLCLGIL